MKVALVYDRINKWGGAERVLLSLHKLFPEAPLFTSVINFESSEWAREFEVKHSFLQNLPFAKRQHEYYAIFMPIAFEQFSFDEFDVVISVTSEAAKGIITKPKTLHISYILTPTRYLWSGYNEYFVNPAFKAVSYPFVSYLRKWDKIASKRPDRLISISNEVRKRVKRYYGEESDVIYPPVLIEETSQKKVKKEPYFLLVSRLVRYKRADIAIEAFNSLGFPLKVVGTGAEERKLRKIAKKNIEFLGTVSEEELANLYRNAKALIFTSNEDFGLVAVEAQSFGTPVIALRSGGALETVIEGKTGEFFNSEDELKNALKNFREENYTQIDCIENAQRFSEERFQSGFMKAINDTIGKTSA